MQHLTNKEAVNLSHAKYVRELHLEIISWLALVLSLKVS